MKSKKREEVLQKKRAAKKAKMANPGFMSKYARKKSYLASVGLFGFQVADPKPWK